MHSLFLQPGDSIDIIAPSSKFDHRALKQVSNIVGKWGLHANISCPMSDKELLCSTNEKSRFDALYSALINPQSKAIWNIWGGYGCMHLLPYLNKISPPSMPKLFMGFSDMTALHLFVNQQWNWPSLHCPSAGQIGLNKVSKQSIDLLKNWLFGQLNPYILDLIPLNTVQVEKDLFAPIVGGNLSIVVSSLATFWQIKPDGKFLFLEEVGEKAYRIDRMLHQLLQANLLNNIKGLIFGEFIQKDLLKMDEQTNFVLKKWAEKLPIPIFSCKAGHGKHNYPILFNCNAKLTIFPKPHLQFVY